MTLAEGSDDRRQVTHRERHWRRHAQHARLRRGGLPGHGVGLVQQHQGWAGALGEGEALRSDAQVSRFCARKQ